MINIIKNELDFDDELKKKIEFICGFCNITPINFYNIKASFKVYSSKTKTDRI